MRNERGIRKEETESTDDDGGGVCVGRKVTLRHRKRHGELWPLSNEWEKDP